MADFIVHTPSGPTTVDAVGRQVDDSGTLGLFGPHGLMVATYRPGEWSDTPFAAPRAPDINPSLEPTMPTETTTTDTQAGPEPTAPTPPDAT